MLSWLGWIATAVFAASYFCRDQVALRRVQALAALLWVAYGVGIGARPVIVANLIVAGVAAWTTLRRRGRPGAPADAADGLAVAKEA